MSSRPHRGFDWAALALAAAIVATSVFFGPSIAQAAKSVPLEPRLGLSAAEKQAGSPGRLAGPNAHPLLVPDEALLRREKRKAARRAALLADPGAHAGSTGGPAAAAGGGGPSPAASVFSGLNALGLVAGTGSPPDSTGAIGPTHYVEMVNNEIGVFSRSTLAPVATADLDDFVGAPGESVFDPQVQWDPQANRWFYVADDVVGPGDNFLAYGWSNSASPLPLDATGWCNRFISTTDEFEDYPKLGHNDNHMIIGTNVFDDSVVDGPFLTSRIWAIAKPASGDTSCSPPGIFATGPSLTTADGDDVFTPVPANTAESSANGYVVAADTPFFVPTPTQVMAWHISGPKASPSIIEDGNMTVLPFDVPANVPQPGTANVLDSLDARLTQAVAVTDPAVGQQAVWTQHTVDGTGGRSEVRWYEFLPGSTTVRQQATVSDPSHFVFNAAISPTSSGDRAAINYNVGSSSQLVDLRAQSRDTGTALNQTGVPVTLGTSPVAGQDFTCDPGVDPCRWGDYAGASPDPNDPTLVWGSNQLNGPFATDPHWVTRNFALSAVDPDPPPNTPPSLTVKGSKNQKNPRFIKVKVSSNENVSIDADGRIKVPKVKKAGSTALAAAKSKKSKLKPAATDLVAGETKTLKLKLKKKTRKKAKQAQNGGKNSKATVNVTATDEGGLETDGKRKIKLKKKKG